MNIINPTEIVEGEIQQTTYRKRKGLLGLITWNEVLRADRRGTFLDITTSLEPTEIWLNGKLLTQHK